MASISTLTSLSSSTSAFLADDTFLGFGMEVDPTFQDVFAAKEQLHQLLEVKQEEDWKQLMEMRWEERMSERDSVAMLVNRQSARMAGEKAVVEIGKRWYIVSVGFFLYLDVWILTSSFSRSQIRSG